MKINVKEVGSPDAVAALGLGIYRCVTSDHRAVRCVLFDGEADRGGCELWTLVNIGDSDFHGDGQPLEAGVRQLSFVLRHNLKL